LLLTSGRRDGPSGPAPT